MAKKFNLAFSSRRTHPILDPKTVGQRETQSANPPKNPALITSVHTPPANEWKWGLARLPNVLIAGCGQYPQTKRRTGWCGTPSTHFLRTHTQIPSRDGTICMLPCLPNILHHATLNRRLTQVTGEAGWSCVAVSNCRCYFQVGTLPCPCTNSSLPGAET